MAERDIERLFEARRGQLDHRVKKDYVNNGIATFPCRISDYAHPFLRLRVCIFFSTFSSQLYLKHRFPFEHSFKHLDILNLLHWNGFDVAVQNNQLRGFSYLDGAGDILQMRLICRMNRMSLQRFLQTDTFLRQ